MPTPVKCQMSDECTAPISHVDRKGYVYCAAHGVQRRAHMACRQLRPAEQKRLALGQLLKRV